MLIHPTEGKRILVFLQDYYSYHIEFIREGVSDYFDQENRNLSYTTMGFGELKLIFGNSIDEQVVVIGTLRDSDSAKFFERHQIPCFNINLLDEKPNLGFSISVEGEATLAAEYFINELRLENLGFVGKIEERGHRKRLEEFKRVAESRHFPVSVHAQKPMLKTTSFVDYLEACSQQKEDQLQQLLKEIKKPAGIFCCDDRIALKLYFTCEAMGISVPDEISILGVGSKAKAKAAWTHPISVVEIDHYRMGYLAAKLLDQYIGTGKAPKSILLKPSGIHHSQTTIQRRVSDTLVREAMILIQQHPDSSVKWIANQLKINRNVLDLRFQRATNVTVSKMLDSERFRKAKELLKENDYNVEAIAALAGFPNRRNMRRCFQRFIKMSPTQFRDLCRKKH